jgi:simple sugar transport system permease protein
VLLTWVGSQYIANLPGGMASVSKATILSTHQGYLHVLVLPVIALALLVAWMLRRTLLGRSIYAIGGDLEAARRVGFHVVRTQLLLYVIVGAMAAFGGVIYVIVGRSANPQTLVGTELDTIASVVLGGASIFGGRGSVTGTVLGVLLIQLIDNSLLLIGVPSAWQRAAVGALLIIGVGVQSVTALRRQRGAVLIQEEVAS